MNYLRTVIKQHFRKLVMCHKIYIGANQGLTRLKEINLFVNLYSVNSTSNLSKDKYELFHQNKITILNSIAWL